MHRITIAVRALLLTALAPSCADAVTLVLQRTYLGEVALDAAGQAPVTTVVPREAAWRSIPGDAARRARDVPVHPRVSGRPGPLLHRARAGPPRCRRSSIARTDSDRRSSSTAHNSSDIAPSKPSSNQRVVSLGVAIPRAVRDLVSTYHVYLQGLMLQDSIIAEVAHFW